MAKNIALDDRRIWLDWSKPALPAAVDWLFERYRRESVWNLSGVIVVTPGARSRQRLLELLVERAELKSLNFTPPDFLPLSQLPERLYVPQHKFASDVIQQVAWAKALRDVGADRLKVLAKNVPTSDGLFEWLPLSRIMRPLHVDLASEALTFGDVANEFKRMQADQSELNRWNLLAQLQRTYYDELSAVGLWDRQAARVTAIKKTECRADADIVLIGLVDLSRVFRQMLNQVAARVHSLIFATETLREGFDELGCLRSEFWLAQPIELSDDQLRIVDRPADQASAVIECLSELDGQFPVSQIAIGIPDRSVVAHLRRALDLADVDSRDSAGKLLTQALPVKLLQAVMEYLQHQQFSQYSRLIRHPDCFDWVSDRIGNRMWLHCIDQFQNEFIPGEFPLRDGFHLSKVSELHDVHRAIIDLLKPLVGHTRRLGQWVEPWTNLLLEVYGGREIDDESSPNIEALFACRALQTALRLLADVPPDWTLEGSAGDALDFALNQVEREALAEPDATDAIELLGWLDLPLDDAAVTIVTGMNEEFVPSSESTHLFLPNSARAQLGILDNARRYARDAYALSLMARSPRHLAIICGRRNDSGDPQLPSRLLFATDDQAMAERSASFFQHQADATSRVWLATRTVHPTTQQFSIPRPAIDALKMTSLSVTDFKQYLQCPYRFYLSRVLKLEQCVDNLAELPPFAFGHLLHEIVEAFGNDPIKDSTDPDEIRKFFRRQLELMMERHGEQPSAAVRIQYQQVRLRLDKLADLQAQRRHDGWEIIEAEVKKGTGTLVVDGVPFSLRGRIDRVDRNEHTGQLAVFDYKTMEPATPPDKAHRKNGEWVDLQLPLYRHLIQTRDYFVSGPILLGYILLPGNIKNTEFAIAEWSEEELRSADQVAFDVIRAVRRNEFWPPADEPPDYSEPWSAICQDDLPERWSTSEVAT